MFESETRHPTVAMATKMDKNEQGTTGTKAKQVRDRFNEKTEQNQKSVYLRNVIQYSRFKKFQKIYRKFEDYKKRKINQKKNSEMKSGEDSQNSGKGRKTVRRQERNSGDTLTEEVTETTFQRTRKF